MEKILNSRIEELDILKAIAIIAVVLAHVLSVVNKNNEIISLKLLFDFIYIWHIPLFFAVFGFLFRHDRPFSKIFLRLIIPCLVFSLPHIIMHIKTSFWSTDVMTNILFELKFLIFGGGYYWFINFLILMQVISKLFIIKDATKSNVFIIVIVLSLYFYLICNFPQLGLIERFLYNYMFFIIGYIASLNVDNMKILFAKKMYIAIYSFIFTYLCYLYLINNIILVKPIIAFIVIAFFTVYSSWLTNKKIRSIFIKIGVTTMPIYLLDNYLIVLEHKYLDNRIILMPILFFANIMVPYILYKFVSKNNITRLAIGG